MLCVRIVISDKQSVITLFPNMSPVSLWVTFQSAAIFYQHWHRNCTYYKRYSKHLLHRGGRSSYPCWGTGCGVISFSQASESTRETNRPDKTGTDGTGQRALIPCLNWIKGIIVRVANEVHVNMSCLFFDLVIYLFWNGVKYPFCASGYILMHRLLYLCSSKISLCWIAVWKKL